MAARRGGSLSLREYVARYGAPPPGHPRRAAYERSTLFRERQARALKGAETRRERARAREQAEALARAQAFAQAWAAQRKRQDALAKRRARYAQEKAKRIREQTARVGPWLRELQRLRQTGADHAAITRAWRKWYRAKNRMRDVIGPQAYADVIETVGRSLGLADTGSNSIHSYVTS